MIKPCWKWATAIGTHALTAKQMPSIQMRKVTNSAAHAPFSCHDSGHGSYACLNSQKQSSSAWHTKFHGISNIQTWMWSTLHSYGFYDKFYFMPLNPFIRGSWLFRAALLADLRGVAWRAALEVAPFSVVFPAPLLRGVFALATLALETAPWRTFTTDKTEGASLFPETACLLFSTHIRNAFETRSANTSASPRLISKACIAPSLSGCSLTRLVFSATSHRKSR